MRDDNTLGFETAIPMFFLMQSGTDGVELVLNCSDFHWMKM